MSMFTDSLFVHIWLTFLFSVFSVPMARVWQQARSFGKLHLQYSAILGLVLFAHLIGNMQVIWIFKPSKL